VKVSEHVGGFNLAKGVADEAAHDGAEHHRDLVVDDEVVAYDQDREMR
jgi:hypothetical protein